MDIKERVGKNIKRYRTQQNITQEELAFMAEIDRTYMPSIEKGIRNISIGVLEKIANALKVEMVQLLAIPSENEKLDNE